MRGGLLSVPGVTEVLEEDREIWVVRGTPSGPSLAVAAAEVVDVLADRIRAADPDIHWNDRSA
jgi:hypothetical protein